MAGFTLTEASDVLKNLVPQGQELVSAHLMTRKRSQLQAYFAGIIDGEGCIVGRNNGNTYGCSVSVNMDDPQAIALMHREYPEARLTKRIRAVGKPYYNLAFNHYKSWRFLEEITPFLLIKHEQAKVAMSFLTHRRRDHAGKHGKGFDCTGRCERYVQLLKDLKRKPKGKNSVDALLSHELREYRAERSEVEADVAAMSAEIGVLDEGVETRLMASTAYKTISLPEKEIVHLEVA